jgi:hypothetical protein
MNKFIRETSMTLFDDKLIHCSIGTAGQVNFDFEYCWNLRKQYKPKHLTMIHVHPDNFLKMSSIDRNMVKGWAMAFGIPIIFIIISKVKWATSYSGKNVANLGYVKYVVSMHENKPIIYETQLVTDFYKTIIIGSLHHLTEASTNSWLNNIHFNRLNKKIGKKIELSKKLL